MKDLHQRLLIAALVAFGGFCFWKAMPGLQHDKPLSRTVEASTVSAHSPARNRSLQAPATRPTALTTPIQDLRVGMRVVGRNPLDNDAQRDLPQPEPETWRLVRTRIEMEPGSFCDLELLRPLLWLEITEAEPGATIWLDLPEMHIAGEAEVLAVEPCPPLEQGTNPVITGTFRHLAPEVIDLHVEGSDAPIGCTPQHPFWSETRNDFVPASSLEPGEEVLTAYGNSARITTIIPRAGPQTVYGLEVYGEHVYHVGEESLLAHNASGTGKGIPRPANGTSYSFQELKTLARTSLDFSTTKHGAVFWSGKNMKVAQRWARRNGKTTLEQTAGGKFLHELGLFGPRSGLTGAQAAEVWNIASARFAKGASGNVNVFSTGTTRMGDYGLRTWWKIEQPILRSNPSVSKISRRRLDGQPVGG